MVVELTERDIRCIDKDWEGFTKIFPEGWEDKPYSTNAVERPLRNFKSHIPQ
jgi:hypothetical protein